MGMGAGLGLAPDVWWCGCGGRHEGVHAGSDKRGDALVHTAARHGTLLLLLRKNHYWHRATVTRHLIDSLSLSGMKSRSLRELCGPRPSRSGCVRQDAVYLDHRHGRRDGWLRDGRLVWAGVAGRRAARRLLAAVNRGLVRHHNDIRCAHIVVLRSVTFVFRSTFFVALHFRAAILLLAPARPPADLLLSRERPQRHRRQRAPRQG
mmetsp:Transcript_20816/g.50754  ORF Transcript_20816/g.50754 Transcript_20816/m.50754 type:complete len:206 (+) Transcript_20816:113-730(+)